MRTLSLRSSLRLSAVLVLATLLTAGSGLSGFSTASAQTESVTFTLENGTDLVMVEFFVVPPDVDDWEEDILGRDVLEPGDGVTITVDDGRDDCTYDFLAVFEDGDSDIEVEITDAEVCDGGSFTFTHSY